MAKGKSRTAKFYQTHPESRKKHSDDNNSGSGGKYAHTKEYKRKHANARNRMKINPDEDVVFNKDGSAGKMSRKKNRALGGAKRR